MRVQEMKIKPNTKCLFELMTKDDMYYTLLPQEILITKNDIVFKCMSQYGLFKINNIKYIRRVEIYVEDVLY